MTGALTMSSFPNANTILELVHIVGTTDDLAQILPMFRNFNGAVNVVGEIKSLILNFMMFPIFFAMNFVCSRFEQNCSNGHGELGTTFHILSSLFVLICFTSLEHALTTDVCNLTAYTIAGSKCTIVMECPSCFSLVVSPNLS